MNLQRIQTTLAVFFTVFRHVSPSSLYHTPFQVPATPDFLLMLRKSEPRLNLMSSFTSLP